MIPCISKTKHLLASLCFMFLGSSVTAHATDLSSPEAVMTSYIEFYMAGDVEGLTSLLPADSKVDMWGTGIDEDITSAEQFRTQIQRDMNEVDTRIKLHNLRTILPESEKVKVVLGEWAVEYKSKEAGSTWSQMPVVRTTLVVEQQNDKTWRLRHGHWSTPFGDQPEGRSYPNPPATK